MYIAGVGVPQDPTSAIPLLNQAAQEGHAPAMCNLVFACKLGRGLPKDPAQALHWFDRAADSGSALAMYHAGLMHESGQACAPDPVHAASPCPTPDAAATISQQHFRSNASAAAWIVHAGRLADNSAMLELGFAYQSGRFEKYGIPHDTQVAKIYFQQAANLGNSSAQCRIDQNPDDTTP